MQLQLSNRGKIDVEKEEPIAREMGKARKFVTERRTLYLHDENANKNH